MADLSSRSIRRLVAAGELEREQRRIPGHNGYEAVFNPKDVEALVAKRAPRPHVMPAGVELMGPSASLPAPGVALAFDWRPLCEFLEPLRAVMVRAIEPAPPPAPLLPWIGPSEASQYLGLSESLIRKLIRTGKLPHLRDGAGFKVNRADLDKLAGLSRLADVTADVRETVKARRAGR